MAGKPHRSSLIPYTDEIIRLRRRKPPTTFAEIADLLREKYNLTVQPPAIFKFIKVRSRGRKVYSYGLNRRKEKPASAAQSTPVGDLRRGSEPKPKFEFKYSERYNLTRLPPEVAAARRKKLEEEGH